MFSHYDKLPISFILIWSKHVLFSMSPGTGSMTRRSGAWYTLCTRDPVPERTLSEVRQPTARCAFFRHTSGQHLENLKIHKRKSITDVFKWFPQLGKLAQSLFYNISGPLVDFAVLVGITTDGTFYSLGKKAQDVMQRTPDTTPTNHPKGP